MKNNPYDYRACARALLPLCGGLDAARSARVANAVLAVLGDGETIGQIKSGVFTQTEFAEVLTSVTERLDESGNLRAAEELVRVLRKADSTFVVQEEWRIAWRIALVSASRRLDVAGTGARGRNRHRRRSRSGNLGRGPIGLCGLARGGQRPSRPVSGRIPGTCARGFITCRPGQCEALASTYRDSIVPVVGGSVPAPGREERGSCGRGSHREYS